MGAEDAGGGRAGEKLFPRERAGGKNRRRSVLE